MSLQPDLERYESSNGAIIFRIPLQVFPGYWAYSHWVTHNQKQYLIDVGSGFGDSHPGLLEGLARIEAQYALPASLENLDYIIITHGHIDHFGGLALVKEIAKNAKVCVQELARPVLVNYDERVLITSQRMMSFLEQAGIPTERQQRLMDLRRLGKQTFKPQTVDIILSDGQVFDEMFSVFHVPGHEPGLVMLKIGDILLTADHILPNASVALAPESIMPFTGVAHYIESLDKAAKIEDVRLALGGHEAAMPDYYEVVRRTRSSAMAKVERVYELCAAPRTIFEIATEIYGPMDGYSELLKLGQTGARIEYLSQRGLVTIDNLNALDGNTRQALHYRQV